MIQILLDVIAPVALVVALGYGAVKLKFYPNEGVSYLTKYAHSFAVPLLLFNAVRSVDLAQSFDPILLTSYFVPAFIVFLAGFAVARYFGKGPQSSAVLGFCALFANSVYIGLPITERAYGADALSVNYVVLSIHAAFCYIVGSIAIQIVRPDAANWGETGMMIVKDIFKNPLIIGVLAGFVVNIAGVNFPHVVDDAIAMMVRTALPVALFALGGVLTKLTLRGELRLISSITALRMVVHPTLVLIFAHFIFHLPLDIVRPLVLISALPTGTNGYIFAALYEREEETAASVVFLATLMAMINLPIWIIILGWL